MLRNYRGRRYTWRQPREDEALVAAGTGEPEYDFNTAFEAEQEQAAKNGKKKRRSRRVA